MRAEGSAAPVYPPELIQQGMKGSVLTSFVIDTTGRADTAIDRDPPGDAPAVRAVGARRRSRGCASRRPRCRDARCGRWWSSGSSSASRRRPWRRPPSTRGPIRCRDGASRYRLARVHRIPSRRALLPPRALRRHNDRAWFEAQSRDATRRSVRAPLAALVEEVDVRLATIAPGDRRRSEALALPHPSRRPLLERQVAVQDARRLLVLPRRRRARRRERDDRARRRRLLLPHRSRAARSLGGGIWMPPRPTLARLRERIDEEPRVARASAAPARAAPLRWAGRGGDARAHAARLRRRAIPAATLLRHQSFTVGRELTERELFSPGSPISLARDYARILPLVRWLNGALGLRTLARR